MERSKEPGMINLIELFLVPVAFPWEDRHRDLSDPNIRNAGLEQVDVFSF